jgi:endonuclease/exonuclease/phosphatase family metal-dependent hydrolase
MLAATHHPSEGDGGLSSARIVLSVANFNMHAGVDGWGRPFDVVAVCDAFNVDVLVLEEAWTNDSDGAGAGQAEQIAAALGYQVTTCALAEGRRPLPHPAATDRWMPRLGFRVSGRSLYLGSVRPLSAAEVATSRYQQGQPGSWGIAVLTRGDLTVEDTRILHLPSLPRDRVRRAAIVVELTKEGVPFSVVGAHMSHLEYGSHRHYAALKRLLRVEARPDAVLLGDMNLWGPPVRAFLPEWHRAVKGRTWPAWNPHSQIDHILFRGALRVRSGEVLPAVGSDHRPVRAELDLR